MEMKDYFVCESAKLVGLPYIWGGSSPVTGFDCSGLMVYLLQTFAGFPADFDTTAQGLHKKYAKDKPIEPGDFVFYGRSPSEVTHVMLALNDKWCIGASGGDHTTLTPEIAANQNAMIKVKPINYRSDFLGVGSV